MAESQIEKDDRRRHDLQSAIEIAKAYAEASVPGRSPDLTVEIIEKTYRMIRKLRKEED